MRFLKKKSDRYTLREYMAPTKNKFGDWMKGQEVGRGSKDQQRAESTKEYKKAVKQYEQSSSDYAKNFVDNYQQFKKNEKTLSESKRASLKKAALKEAKENADYLAVEFYNNPEPSKSELQKIINEQAEYIYRENVAWEVNGPSPEYPNWKDYSKAKKK